ncbi:MAG TPA: antitoxin AF2212-like protein, partial [Anaerolineae bacterium]|nr:antitoxin AF2212-like protein [Anaerolineae bacterium]
MSEIITAIYENGTLRPLRPPRLRERQTVRLQVLAEESVDEIEQAIQSLIA